MCENIKSKDILIYTILFDVKDSGVEDLLRSCATTPEMSYRAESSQEVHKAFEDIGIALSKLRLVE